MWAHKKTHTNRERERGRRVSMFVCLFEGVWVDRLGNGRFGSFLKR